MSEKSFTLMICDFGEGGIQFRTKSVIELLIRNSINVNLICDFNDVTYVKKYIKHTEFKIRVFPIKIRGFNIFLNLLSLSVVLFNLRKDVFLVFTPKANTFAQIISTALMVKQRVTFINGFYKKQFVCMGKNVFYIKIYESLLFLNYILATDIYVSSKSLLDSLPNIIRDKAKVLYGFLPNSYNIGKAEVKMPFRKGLDYIIIYNGRLSEEKGVHYLIKAFFELQKKYSDIRLLILGEDQKAYALSMKKMVIELGLEQKVYFTGYVDNVSDYLISSKVMVLPSTTESFGYAILEAWKNRIPVIASNIEGPAEIIDNKINGLLFEVSNIQDLICKFDEIYNGKFEIEKITENGYDKLNRLYSQEQFSNTILQLLKNE